MRIETLKHATMGCTAFYILGLVGSLDCDVIDLSQFLFSTCKAIAICFAVVLIIETIKQLARYRKAHK